MRIPEIGTVVAQAAASRVARLGRDHVHRLAEPRRRSRSSASRSRPRRPSGCSSRPASPTRSRVTRPRSPTSPPPCRRRRAAGSCSASAGATPRCSISVASPMPVDRVRDAVTDLQAYLANETLDCNGRPSRLQFARPLPAAEGAARHRGVGPAHDRARRRASPNGSRSRSAPTRIASRGRSTSPRKAAADAGRDPGRDLVRRVRQRRLPSRPRRGTRADQRRGRRVRALLVDARVDRRGPRRGRPRRSSPRSAAATTATSTSATPPRTPTRSTPEFVDRFAVVGPPDVCARSPARRSPTLGLERFVITGASFRADRDHARTAEAAAHRRAAPGTARTERAA